MYDIIVLHKGRGPPVAYRQDRPYIQQLETLIAGQA